MFTFLHVNPTLVSWMNRCFFFGQFLSKLNQKSMISHQGFFSGFFMEKMVQICQIPKPRIPNYQIFMRSSSRQQRIQKDSAFFYFHIYNLAKFSQIWLNHFLDDCHFCYITKSLGKTLGWISIFRENIIADQYNKIKMVHFKIRRIRFRGTTHDP